MRAFAPLLAASALLCGCSATPQKPPPPPDPQQVLGRTLQIIRTSTPAHPHVLKVLFYGQSITSPKWTDQATARLRKDFPNVAFDVRNMALGGFAADRLEHTTERDIRDFYPDLIVFHVYGDNRAYERIIRMFRSMTAADVIVSTDHVQTPPERICPSGIRLRWSPPPGCAGHIWFKQRNWQDFMSGVWIPVMAQRYGLAIEPRRERWEAYLEAHKLQPNSLLADPVHPNAAGWQLMANLFTSWFEGVVAGKLNRAIPPSSTVMTRPPPTAGVPATYEFSGNRIEILAAGPLNGKVRAVIDGKPPVAFDGCWLDSRVSRLPTVTDWPAVSRVGVDPAYHRQDTWTVRVSDMNEAEDKFDFTLTSMVEGAQGSGTGDRPFVSKTGHVTIDPVDWNLAYGHATSGKIVPNGSTFTWQRRFVCNDQVPVKLPNGGSEQRYVVATGLTNGRHSARLSIDPAAPAVLEVRTYRPPLKT